MFARDYFLSVSHQLVKNEQFSLLPIAEPTNTNFHSPPFELMKNDRLNLSFIRLAPFHAELIFDHEEMERLSQNAKLILSQSGARKLKLFHVYVFQSSPTVEFQHQIQKYATSLSEKKIEIYLGFVDLTTQQMGFPGDVFDEMNIDKKTFLTFFTETHEDPVVLINEIEQIENQRRKEIRQTFQYGKPYFSYIFIALNALLYVLMEIKGGSTNPMILLQFGAKQSYLITQGEYWRLITPIFLHIGFIHFALNSAALHYLGQLAERMYGSFRFVIIYLLAGIIGNIASFYFSPNSIGAGASGSIFGLFGALLYFGYMNPGMFFKTIGRDIISIVALNLVFGLTMANIDNYAHIGGLIGGFLVAGLVRLPNQKRSGRGKH